jgi:hypothetical protein
MRTAASRRIVRTAPALVPPPPIYLGAYNGQAGDGHYQIGLATSRDSYVWSKITPSQGVIRPSASGWDSSAVFQPWLLKIAAGDYRIWYAGWPDGVTSKIGVATSGDTITWSKYGGNPVLSLGGSGAWDEHRLAYPTVLYEPSDVGRPFKMWYTASSVASPGVYQGGYAYSTDGVAWTKSSANPVLTNGGSYDSVQAAPGSIYKSGSTYYLYYSGTNVSGTPSQTKVCLATFTDPEGTYTKAAGNPILSPATGSQSLTADLSSGSQTVTVADTSAFNVGEPCLLLDATNLVQADVKIGAINSSTQMTLIAPVTYSWTTAHSSRICSAYFESGSARTVLTTPGGYLMYQAPYQQFGNTLTSERSAAATSASLGSGWTYDYTRGLTLPLGSWDALSAENLSVIAV